MKIAVQLQNSSCLPARRRTRIPSRDRKGVAMALRAAKVDGDATRSLWGQRFGAAAELPLGAELYVLAGSTGDLVADVRTNHSFNGAFVTVIS